MITQSENMRVIGYSDLCCRLEKSELILSLYLLASFSNSRIVLKSRSGVFFIDWDLILLCCCIPSSTIMFFVSVKEYTSPLTKRKETKVSMSLKFCLRKKIVLLCDCVIMWLCLNVFIPPLRNYLNEFITKRNESCIEKTNFIFIEILFEFQEFIVPFFSFDHLKTTTTNFQIPFNRQTDRQTDK